MRSSSDQASKLSLLTLAVVAMDSRAVLAEDGCVAAAAAADSQAVVAAAIARATCATHAQREAAAEWKIPSNMGTWVTRGTAVGHRRMYRSCGAAELQSRTQRARVHATRQATERWTAHRSVLFVEVGHDVLALVDTNLCSTGEAQQQMSTNLQRARSRPLGFGRACAAEAAWRQQRST